MLPAGFAGDGAYWIDRTTGTWITSTYYRSQLPKWAQDFNDSKRAEKYLNQEWKDNNGKVLRYDASPQKEGQPISMKWSVPRHSPTTMNSNSRGNWSPTKSWATVPPPIF